MPNTAVSSSKLRCRLVHSIKKIQSWAQDTTVWESRVLHGSIWFVYCATWQKKSKLLRNERLVYLHASQSDLLYLVYMCILSFIVNFKSVVWIHILILDSIVFYAKFSVINFQKRNWCTWWDSEPPFLCL